MDGIMFSNARNSFFFRIGKHELVTLPQNNMHIAQDKVFSITP